jgi:LAO/AO transport system kinase
MLNLSHPVKRIFRHHGHMMEAMPMGGANEDVEIWLPPIHKTVATDGTGILALGEAIAQHQAYLNDSGDWARRERTRLAAELENLLGETLMTQWRAQITDGQYQAVLDRVFSRDFGPGEAVKRLLDDALQASIETS